MQSPGRDTSMVRFSFIIIITATAILLLYCYLHQGAYKSNQLISLKLGIMIGPTNQKNWLTFRGDPVPDTDSRSLFQFSHRCGIGHFLEILRE